METFLDITAKKILEQYPPKELNEICVVFPNRRAGVFFRKSLWRQAKQAFFLPDIYAMEDFVLRHTGLQQMDTISLSFELFEVHKALNQNKGSFDEFLKYGNTILRDFNELDMHMADIQKAFSFLEDYRELKLWGLEKHELSDFQKKYLDFFKSLSDYYEKLKQRLLDKKSAYQGLAFRQMAEHMEEYFDNLPYKKVFFVGFNALTPSEQHIVDYFLKNSTGEVIWDADEYYLLNPNQEAGQHLRKLFQNTRYKNDFVGNNFENKPKDINIYGCPGDVSQVKMVGELLKEISEEEEIAVVLADETLLEPLLNSIPDNISSFNVTMGLPLGNTPLYSLFENLFRLHVSPYKTRKAKITESGKIHYYYKDVLRVMAHPLVKKLFEWRFSSFNFSRNALVNHILQQNKAYYSVDDLKILFEQFDVTDFRISSFLWEDWQQNADKALDSFLELLQSLRDMVIDQGAEEGENQLLLEYLYRFSNVFQTMHNLHADYGTLKNPDVLWRFLIQLINRETISFRGEPLKGIQIMGMLETRLLDFERIILVSANEEYLPGGQFDITMMPYEMRLNYKLPMKKDKAAIYAYHFYSLIQRTKQVDIIYNTVIEGNKGSEMSRFVKQIIHELPKYSQRNIIGEYNIAIKPDLDKQNQSIEIEKSTGVMKLLRQKAQSGFAATTLNKYRLCPLKYYLEEILNLEEQEEVEETIEARTLGNVVHDTLERLYKELEGKEITLDAIEKLRKKFNGILIDVFKEQYKSQEIFSGKNLLIYNVASYWLEAFFKKEKEDLESYQKEGQAYHLIGTEAELKGTITINHPEENFEVEFKGKVDRMDEVGGRIRIIDYKTGQVNQQNVSFKDFQQLMDTPAKKEAFQLLSYHWLYRENYPESREVMPAIFSFPAFNNDYMYIKYSGDKGVEDDSLDLFEGELKALLNEIFDKDIPFRQTEDRQLCRNCDFKDLCNRYN